MPIHEQVKQELLTLIRLNICTPHSRLPSIRSIAADAGINVNTVKKAFADLESKGVIYTVPGTGSFVSEKALDGENLHDAAINDFIDALNAAKSRGIAKEELIETIISNFEKE